MALDDNAAVHINLYLKWRYQKYHTGYDTEAVDQTNLDSGPFMSPTHFSKQSLVNKPLWTHPILSVPSVSCLVLGGWSRRKVFSQYILYMTEADSRV